MSSDHDQPIGASLQIAIELRGQAATLATQAEAEQPAQQAWAAKVAAWRSDDQMLGRLASAAWASAAWASALAPLGPGIIAQAHAYAQAEQERQRAVLSGKLADATRAEQPVGASLAASMRQLEYLAQAIAAARALGCSARDLLELLRQLADAAEGSTPDLWSPTAIAQLAMLRLQEIGIASRAELAAEGLQLGNLGQLLGTPAELLQAALAVMRRKFPPTYAAEAEAQQLGRLLVGGLASGIRADAGQRMAEAVRKSRRMGRKKIRRHLRRLQMRSAT